jgi:E3 ubiquitin-protein ligase DMA1/2
VDEPTEGEWEELNPSDLEPNAAAQVSSGEEQDSRPIPPPDIPEPRGLSQIPSTNVEPVSDGAQGGYSTEELIDNLDINDRGRECEPRSQQTELSAPIDIAGSRRSISERRNDDESDERRTPSPGHRSPDVLSGVEGPMTPRNDAGPFIFDGSGGHRIAARTATPNMGSVVEALTLSP